MQLLPMQLMGFMLMKADKLWKLSGFPSLDDQPGELGF